MASEEKPKSVPPSEAPIDPKQAERILEEQKRKGTSGLNWDETEKKPGQSFNRVTEMGEAD